MSVYLGGSSLAFGSGMLLYGGYKWITARQKPDVEAKQQKQTALKIMTAGIAAITVGAGVLYAGQISDPIQINQDNFKNLQIQQKILEEQKYNDWFEKVRGSDDPVTVIKSFKLGYNDVSKFLDYVLKLKTDITHKNLQHIDVSKFLEMIRNNKNNTSYFCGEEFYNSKYNHNLYNDKLTEHSNKFFSNDKRFCIQRSARGIDSVAQGNVAAVNNEYKGYNYCAVNDDWYVVNDDRFNNFKDFFRGCLYVPFKQ